MPLPVGCLCFSRHVLARRPLSDNLAGNVVGLSSGRSRASTCSGSSLPIAPAGAAPVVHGRTSSSTTEATRRGARQRRHDRRPKVGPRWPSSATSSRSSGRLRPTTLWWSPSMRAHERAAQAVDGERPGDLQRLAGGDVRRDLVVGDVREVHGRPGGRPRLAGGGVAQAVAGVQDAGAPAHRRQRRTASSGSPGLPSASPSSSSTESQPSTRATAGTSARVGDGAALELGEVQGQLGRGRPVELRLVDAGDDDHGSRPAPRRVARRAGEAEARTNGSRGHPGRARPDAAGRQTVRG